MRPKTQARPPIPGNLKVNRRMFMSMGTRQHTFSMANDSPELPDIQAIESSTWEGQTHSLAEKYRLVSLFTSAPNLDPMRFLMEGHGSERLYWSEPATGKDSLTMAGIGIAAEVRVSPILDTAARSMARPAYRFDEVESGLQKLFDGAIWQPADCSNGENNKGSWVGHPARPRLFGGFAFQDDFVPDNTWATFNPAQFILPHYQLIRHGQDTYLTINALIGLDEDVAQNLNDLREALLARLRRPGSFEVSTPNDVREVRYPMSADLWQRIVKQATNSIHEGRLDKVVLSRVCEIETESDSDSASAMAFLNAHYSDSYRFLFEPVPKHAFWGATPELLIHKSGSQITTMALAGSIARGSDPAQDEALAIELRTSPKERLEHQLVAEAIFNNLDDVTAELSIAEAPVVLRLRNIQHLLSPVTGVLSNPATSLIALVRRLHPTPALGGAPVGEALAFLRENEPVPRGWYAGPIGWVDPRGDGTFVVAIRSAVTRHERVWLYAGAGIVGDSQPEREWAETALKFRPMLDALGVRKANQDGSER